VPTIAIAFAMIGLGMALAIGFAARTSITARGRR
jgi:hypothetical protein